MQSREQTNTKTFLLTPPLAVPLTTLSVPDVRLPAEPITGSRA